MDRINKICTKSKTLAEKQNTRCACRHGQQNKKSKGIFYAFAPQKCSLSVCFGRMVQYAPTIHQCIIFQNEGMGCILSPLGIVLQHEIIAQFCSCLELEQAVRLLKRNLLYEIQPIRCRKENSCVADHQGIFCFRKKLL